MSRTSPGMMDVQRILRHRWRRTGPTKYVNEGRVEILLLGRHKWKLFIGREMLAANNDVTKGGPLVWANQTLKRIADERLKLKNDQQWERGCYIGCCWHRRPYWLTFSGIKWAIMKEPDDMPLHYPGCHDRWEPPFERANRWIVERAVRNM